jgi:hypothetical protein
MKLLNRFLCICVKIGLITVNWVLRKIGFCAETEIYMDAARGYCARYRKMEGSLCSLNNQRWRVPVRGTGGVYYFSGNTIYIIK